MTGLTRARAFLKRNRLMTLGTCRGGRPWGATLFYAPRLDFSLLFFSRPDSRHGRDIAENPRVSVVVNQLPLEKKRTIRGLQIVGHARKVPKRQYTLAYGLYRKHFPWADGFAKDHVLYDVIPKEVWYIDQKLFGHHFRVRITTT